jgi:acetyl esterase/lipase
MAAVALIHGGFWCTPFTKKLMAGLAGAVVARGWAAWNIEYRRMGLMGGRGGWPATFEDVTAAVQYLASVECVDPDRVAVCGHSAGGQLALLVAGRELSGVRVRAAVSLAGLVDLDEAAALGLGAGAVGQFLGGTPAQVAERYRAASPAARLPIGVPQLLVHGTEDAVVPPHLSEGYHHRALAHGDDAAYAPVAGGHRDVIDPRTPAWSVVADYLEPRLS